ncbi:MAG: metallophosphoesterase [Bacteroidetes bacterium]|nr:metallophosphoesterase [Bacteroidota bacterium]
MKYLFSLVFFLFLHALADAKIVMTPYLQSVTQTSVYVLVECDNSAQVTVMYGLTPEYGLMARTEIAEATTAKRTTYVHKVLLQGLMPGSRYYYQATQGKSISKVAAFSTAVLQGMPFRMVWMADCRTGTAVFAKISRNMVAADPAVALYGGDLCHSAKYAVWKKEFFIKDQLKLASQVPFFNATGNHEGWEQNTRAFMQNPSSGSRTQDYYSFDYGDLHVLCLNTMVPYAPGTPQFEFAKKDLEQTRQTWKIVMAHIPAYCSGGHGEDAGMVTMTKKIFEPNKVDMVLAGHSHFYQNNLVRGIHHLVIGSAGAPLYTPQAAAYTVTQAFDYNFAVFDVSTATLKMRVYNAELKVLDSLEIAK